LSTTTPTRSSRSSWILWTLLVGVVLYMQWPMLKGSYYRSRPAAPPPASFEWTTDLDTALADARTSGRLVFVDFHATWCPPCITMKHEVWPDQAVGAALKDGFIPVAIDVDRDPRVSARYDVRAIPTLLVLDSDGAVVDRATYLGKGGLLRWLDEHRLTE
jgi:thiol:disulfide interchange protein